MKSARLLLPLVLFAAACAPSAEVTRVLDGRVDDGRFIAPDAYNDFLRGALAEEAGRPAVALAAYAEAASRDASDPEIWTRIGAIRCATSPRDSRATDALDRALAIDPAYAPALTARARCSLARGEDAAARLDAQRAAAADPTAVAPAVLLGELCPGRGGDAVREQLVALTLIAGTSPAAWDALAAWGTSHHDSMLVARALAEVGRLVPARRAELAGRALALAGDGELAAARSLAAALADAPGDRSSGGEGPAPTSIPLLARLAIDEALSRGDAGAATRRAVRSHVGLDVAAGRALLLGDAQLARELAGPVVRADPRAPGARMVLAAANQRLGDARRVADALDVPPAARPASLSAPPEALLPFAKLLERTGSAEAARRLLDAFAPVALLTGDALVAPVAVGLATLGALPDDALPLDARIELAARRSEPMPSFDVRSAIVDARHRLFAWALTNPRDADTLELARRLSPAASHDSLIAVAITRLTIASGAVIAPDALDPILAVDPADPILAAAALDLAKRTGDARAIAPARARLTALARTAGERARALE